jgi:hypothetical protein
MPTRLLKHLAMVVVALVMSACASVDHIPAEPVTPLSAAPRPEADPKVWGAYAYMAGRTWVGGNSEVRVAWQETGKVLREEWRWGPQAAMSQAGELRWVVTVRPGAKPGRLVAQWQHVSGAYDDFRFGPYDGKVDKDGGISFDRQDKWIGGAGYQLDMSGLDSARYVGTAIPWTRFDAVTPMAGAAPWPVPANDAWGLYQDLVGRTWHVQTSRPHGLLVRVGWLVPGRVLYERFDALDADNSFVHVVRLAKGGLHAEASSPRTYEAAGTAGPDQVKFIHGSKLLGQDWSYLRDRDGQVTFKACETGCVEYRGPMRAVDVAEAIQLIADARQSASDKEQRERRASAERLASFNATMKAVNAGLAQANSDLQKQRPPQPAPVYVAPSGSSRSGSSTSTASSPKASSSSSSSKGSGGGVSFTAPAEPEPSAPSRSAAPATQVAAATPKPAAPTPPAPRKPAMIRYNLIGIAFEQTQAICSRSFVVTSHTVTSADSRAKLVAQVRAGLKVRYPRSHNATYIADAVPEDRSMIVYEYEKDAVGFKCTDQHLGVAIGEDHAGARAEMQRQLSEHNRKFIRQVSRWPEVDVR